MSLKEKLLQKKSAANKSEQDYEKLKETYTVEVEKLTKMIKDWFKDLLDQKLVTITNTQVQVQDPNIGEYMISSIRIEAGDDTILVMPVGAEIIGASGRVDIYAQGKKHLSKTLLLGDDNNGNLTWLFWSPDTTIHKKGLTQTLFMAVVEGWIE
jgi:hypothetical protein